MASVEREPITGVWGKAPGQGIRGKAPEADGIFYLDPHLLRFPCDILRCCTLFADGI